MINEMSHNLKEIETLLSDEINGLGDLAGSLGGAQKHTWRWNLKFFFMESISIVKGATTVKKEAEKVQRQKSFFLHKYHMLLFNAMEDWIRQGWR